MSFASHRQGLDFPQELTSAFCSDKLLSDSGQKVTTVGGCGEIGTGGPAVRITYAITICSFIDRATGLVVVMLG